MWESLREVILWLRETDREAAEHAVDAYQCLAAYSEDPQSYAWATKFLRASCEDEVVRICQELIRFDTSNYGDGSGPGERSAAPTSIGAGGDSSIKKENTCFNRSAGVPWET